MLVSGALISSFNHTYVKELIAKADLQTKGDREELEEKLTGCTPDRVGGLRWSSPKDLEGCSESGQWRPIRLCDRRCGFSQPPAPSIRPKGRGGALECTLTLCEAACMRRANIQDFPSASEDVCADLFNHYASLHENVDGCRALTAKDVIDDQLTSSVYATGNSGMALLSILNSNQAFLSTLYDSSSGTSKAAAEDVLVCTAESYEECTTHNDRDTVCSRQVDYFPFIKNSAIQRAASLYELTIDTVSTQTAMLDCALVGARAQRPFEDCILYSDNPFSSRARVGDYCG